MKKEKNIDQLKNKSEIFLERLKKSIVNYSNKIERNIEWTTQVAADPTLAMKWIGNIFVEERRGGNSETWSKEGINMDWARNWAGVRKNLSHIYLWDNIFQTNYADNLKSVVVIDLGKNEKQIYNHISTQNHVY